MSMETLECSALNRSSSSTIAAADFVMQRVRSGTLRHGESPSVAAFLRSNVSKGVHSYWRRQAAGWCAARHFQPIGLTNVEPRQSDMLLGKMKRPLRIGGAMS